MLFRSISLIQSDYARFLDSRAITPISPILRFLYDSCDPGDKREIASVGANGVSGSQGRVQALVQGSSARPKR